VGYVSAHRAAGRPGRGRPDGRPERSSRRKPRPSAPSPRNI